MKIHPRYYIVAKARCEIVTAFLTSSEKYELTFGEETRILSGIMDDLGRNCIRQERHPEDPDRKGDEE